jgi:dipeptidyl aminopeptidase/acylaminoacyl peptidase
MAGTGPAAPNGRFRVAFIAVLLLAATTASARDFLVKPGETPELREGEGLVLVSIDTDLAVHSLTVRGASRAFSGGKLSDIGEGHTAGLYVMPAGQYRWDRLSLGWWRWSLRENPEFVFEVKPGKLSYAGDLVFRGASRFHVANRGLRALDWLEENHPALLARHGMTYVGHYPDAFPDFYREQMAAAGNPPPASRDPQRAPPAPGELPLSVQELWKPSRLLATAMSGNGRHVAGAIRESDKLWAVDLYDLEAGTIRRIAESRTEVEDLVWKDDQTLLAQISKDRRWSMLWVFRLREDGTQDTLVLPRPGFLVDRLAGDPGHLLFASAGSRELQVHRVDIRTEAAIKGFRYPLVQRLNNGLANDYRWFTDASGRIRGALVSREESTVLVHGGDGNYRDVLVLDEPGFFQPMAVSGDGGRFYGLSETGRAQRDLVEFDPVARTIGRTIFSKPGVDVVSPITNREGEPVGATYYESGQLISEYFDQARQDLAGTLSRTFPDRTVALLDRSDSGRQNLVWVDGSDQPGRVYHFDQDVGRASLLDESAPWLSGRRLYPATSLKARSSDGLEIEAFLTLPEADGKRPLVVMPHGGPVGVADRRHFDPEVQFLASLGYAVLQVNFRGSEGYGKQFREAAFGNYGTLIEDDIDAAIAAALDRFPLDPSRMCAVGTSYGGYSGLMLAVRSPERFRCVVSVAGVSDRALFFTASDTGSFAEGRAQLEKVIGNPRTQPDLMRATSPLFRYQELTAPVMLVHGGEDMRVDYEHTRRLVRLLGLAGRPPVTLYFEDEGHGIGGEDNRRKTWEGIAGFLREHLDGPSAAAAAAH